MAVTVFFISKFIQICRSNACTSYDRPILNQNLSKKAESSEREQDKLISLNMNIWSTNINNQNRNIELE